MVRQSPVQVLLLTAAGLLAACVTTSDIVPVGKDAYVVSAVNGTCGYCRPPKTRATDQAGAYCARMGKTMFARDAQEQAFNIGFGTRYTLTFSCEDATAAK